MKKTPQKNQNKQIEKKTPHHIKKNVTTSGKKPKTKTIEIKNYSFKNREKASSFNINITSNIYMYVSTKKIVIWKFPFFYYR